VFSFLIRINYSVNTVISKMMRFTLIFLPNYFSDRAGWIPKFEEFTLNLASQYGWVYGLSVTEMEIVHGAMRKLNPNGKTKGRRE